MPSFATHQARIEAAFAHRQTLQPETAPSDLITTVNEIIDCLDQGTLRIAEKIDGQWHTHTWLKQAVLLYFRLYGNQPMQAGCLQFYDKVPLKYSHKDASELAAENVRIVPSAIVRKGAYVAPNTVLMPSYVNIGARIDSGAMIDTWATVGSCAQIGKNVHLSGGVGIGGVLEPLQANPTIIEDNCFIGARSEVVEGVIVGEGSVISMGVYLGQSTRIYDRQTDKVTYGYIPPNSVVVPGNLPAANGKYSLYCAVIVKQVDAKTREKVSLNELLRDIAD